MLMTLKHILPIFMLIVMGYVTKAYMIQEDTFWKNLEKITYYILFPALLIHGLASVDLGENIHQIVVPLILATALLGATLILLQRKLATENARFTSYFQGAIRYNSYIFIAVASVLFGPDALPIVTLIIAYMIVFTNVFSIMVLNIYVNNNKINIVSILTSTAKNPLILSCFLGIIFNKLHFLYFDLVDNLLGILGASALSISLMCVGSGLKLKFLFQNFNSVFVIAATKLLILPIISGFFLYLFGVPMGLEKNIAILYSAVPCAGNAYILALQMRGDHEIMAAIIAASTLASIVTIPIVIALMPFFFN